MILLERALTEITAGYDQISRAQAELLSRWRGPLLAAYARRMQVYQQALAAHQSAIKRHRAASYAGILLGTLAILLSTAACPAQLIIEKGDFNWRLVCLSPLTLIIGVVAIAVLARRWRQRKAAPAPTPPPHPLRDELFPPLLPQWRAELRGYLPEKLPDEGVRGEYKLVEALEKVRSQSYILHRTQQRAGEDIDVTVVGPRGVWVFEVKHWSGKIIYRDGKWSHLKSYFEPGGEPVTREKEIGQPPDQQWQRTAADVAETLQRRQRDLVTQIPALSEVKGGLVFSHDNAERQIENMPVSWGTIAFWEQHFRKSPLVPGVEERQVYLALDALLARHRQVSQETETRSMKAAAERLTAQAEKALQDWINN